jgi:hypothetical protein
MEHIVAPKGNASETSLKILLIHWRGDISKISQVENPLLKLHIYYSPEP